MAVGTLPPLRGAQYQTAAFFASSTQETRPVTCTLFVALVERKGNFIIDTVVIGAEWVEN